MNGAAAVLDKNTSTPNTSRITTIGSSHHFLLWLRKCQNSATIPVCCAMLASVSKSAMEPPDSGLAKILTNVCWRGLGSPVRCSRGRPAQLQLIAPDRTEEQCHGRKDPVEDKRERDA